MCAGLKQIQFLPQFMRTWVIVDLSTSLSLWSELLLGLIYPSSFFFLQIVIHAMQCTHYIILWHLAKVSDGSSVKVLVSKCFRLLYLEENYPMLRSFFNFQNVAPALRGSLWFQLWIPNHFRVLGRYGDTKKTNECFLLDVSALH